MCCTTGVPAFLSACWVVYKGLRVGLIGIDIGNTSCKLAVHEGRGVRLISGHMPANMVRDGDVSSPDTMSEFLRTLRRDERIRERDCALVLTSTQLYFRHVTLPAMTLPELVLNLPYEFRDFIQDDPEDYIYDYAVDEVKRNEEGEVERLELFASAVPRSLVTAYADMLRKAGFHLKFATPSQMAYMRLLKSNVEQQGVGGEASANRDTMLVDIGQSNVAISLFHGTHYDSARTIDVGCDEFDHVIADLKGIDPYTAESYKFTNFENVLEEPECLAVCDRFALEVSKVVNFYNFSNPEREIGMLYFMGGGASISQLTNAISEAIAVPAASIEELLPPEMRGQENSPVCALAAAGLLEGEAV